jgi:hypothetical protein
MFGLTDEGLLTESAAMTALAISDNGRVLIPAARLHAEVRDGRLALTPASRRYANVTRRYAPILTATCLLPKGAARPTNSSPSAAPKPRPRTRPAAASRAHRREKARFRSFINSNTSPPKLREMPFKLP